MRGRDVPAATLRVVLARRLSPRHFRILTGASVVALIFIIVTGAGVRLTGSGLGCPDWPTCAANRVVAPWRFHAWVEFGNRLVTGAVSIAVVLAVLGALVRAPRRRDLTLLSLGLVAGLVAEIVLGGLTVRHHLAPGFVMGHFLLAAAFLADAVVLHHRAGVADDPCPPGPDGCPGPDRARPGGPGRRDRRCRWCRPSTASWAPCWWWRPPSWSAWAP